MCDGGEGKGNEGRDKGERGQGRGERRVKGKKG